MSAEVLLGWGSSGKLVCPGEEDGRVGCALQDLQPSGAGIRKD